MEVHWNVNVTWTEVRIILVPKLVVNASAKKTSWAGNAHGANLAFLVTRSAKNVIVPLRPRVTKKQVKK